MRAMASTLLGLVIVVFLSGCTAFFYTPQDLMSSNRAHLSALNTGMTKDEVVKRMGTEGKSDCTFAAILGICMRSELINNPYRTAGFQNDGKAYDVLYYWTDRKQSDGVITDDELTPLLFENGKLIGWGHELIGAAIKRYEIRVR